MGIGNIDLLSAESLAINVKNHISSIMSKVEIAGSIRRRKPIVGDIEIVGIPEDRKQLIKLLDSIGQHIKPGVSGVIPWTPKTTAKYLRIRLNEGINLDVFLGTTENWGGLFMMRTGSAIGLDGNPFTGFIPGIFSRFKKLSKGGRMTNCMPTMPSGEQLLVTSEQDFFNILEMNFVPPEERISKKIIKNYIR